MELNISGLKCDNCTYRNDDIVFEDYKNNIGAKCPECGESLLTQEEYDDCIKLMKQFEILKTLSNIFKWVNPFHYWRLVFGDKRKIRYTEIKYKTITKDNK